MDDKVFESRVLELMFKTDSRLTPQFAAYRFGITVDEARHKLESMAGRDILTLESDDGGALYYELPNRPPPTREPLSWQVAPVAVAPPMPPMPYYPQPMMPVMMPPPPVFLGQEKSVAASILLSFFFGPLGMLYSTVTGALIMFVVGGFFTVITLGLGGLLVWPGGVLWAALAANAHNQRVRYHRHQAAAHHAHQQGYMHQMHQMHVAQMQRQLPPSR